MLFTDFLFYYSFPQKQPLKEEWIKKVSRVTLDGKRWEPTVNSRICSDHFLRDDFEDNILSKRVLKPNAVPTRFPSHRSDKQPYVKLKRLSRKHFKTVFESDHLLSQKNSKSLNEYECSSSQNHTQIVNESDNSLPRQRLSFILETSQPSQKRISIVLESIQSSQLKHK